MTPLRSTAWDLERHPYPNPISRDTPHSGKLFQPWKSLRISQKWWTHSLTKSISHVFSALMQAVHWDPKAC